MEKLKVITNNNWIVLSENDEKLGMLLEITNRYILMIKNNKYEFESREEVVKHFNGDIFNNVVSPVIQEKQIEKYIDGYPVDFESPIECKLENNDLPLFIKKEDSKIYYVAGYFCLNYPKGWMPALCPKLSTLESYEYKGGFKDELSMRTELQKLRKIKR